MEKQSKICDVVNCSNTRKGRKYCSKHEYQLRKYGKIFNRTKYDPNEYEIKGNIAYMLLYNKKQEVREKTMIDFEDVDRCDCFKWTFNAVKKSVTTTMLVDGEKKNVSLPRFLMDVHNKPHTTQVDHISRDHLDNRKSNLRICTPSENSRNSKMYSTNTTGFRGVIFRKDTSKYAAQIWHNNQRIGLGCFETPEEAALVYNEAAKKYHGKFAKLNKIGD